MPVSNSIAEIDTPALLVDLEALEENITCMATYMRDRGKDWRPHAKGHKSPVIAKRQVAAGAIGVTVAKTSEAEVYAREGIRDILIAHCVAGEQKLQRIAELCRIADPIVCCDHFVQAKALSQACRSNGVTCRVLIDIDIGMNRTGLRPGPDVDDLAQAVLQLTGVKLAGVMGYEGHLLTIPDLDEKRRRITSAMAILAEAREQLMGMGVESPIVSAGGTGSFQITADCEGVTEIQAGGGIFADPFYTDTCQVTGLTPSLALMSTVVSRPMLDRAVLDCGRKSLSADHHPPVIVGHSDGPPLPDAEIAMHSAEHLTLTLGPRSRELHIGDKVLIRPGYSDLTALLHGRFYGVRDGRMVEEIPIVARGALQ